MAKNTKPFWQFRAATEDKPAELLLYGDISATSWWEDDVTPKQFKQDLDALGDVAEINVYINSNGGDVFAGQAIHSMLKRHKATINVYVDGLAASIASVVAMAGDTIHMPKNAMMMIHNPWTIAVGNSEDFRKLADDLDKIRESIIVTYQEKSGMERDKIIELMDAETWLTAEEAVDYGLADELEEGKEVAASLDAGFLVVNGQRMDLSRFRNAPKLLVCPKEQSRSESPQEVKQAQSQLSSYLAQIQVNQNRIVGGKNR